MKTLMSAPHWSWQLCFVLQLPLLPHSSAFLVPSNHRSKRWRAVETGLDASAASLSSRFSSTSFLASSAPSASSCFRFLTLGVTKPLRPGVLHRLPNQELLIPAQPPHQLLLQSSLTFSSPQASPHAVAAAAFPPLWHVQRCLLPTLLVKTPVLL